MACAFDLEPMPPNPFGKVVADRVETHAVAAGDDEFREPCGTQGGQGLTRIPR
jgi:hypothetical protein